VPEHSLFHSKIDLTFKHRNATVSAANIKQNLKLYTQELRRTLATTIAQPLAQPPPWLSFLAAIAVRQERFPSMHTSTYFNVRDQGTRASL
jgi:hypothetical protein